MTSWVQLVGHDGFMPHGYCFLWTPRLLWPMVGADAVIAASYFSIPVALVTFNRRRRIPALVPIALLFSAFIFACGVTHIMDIWTIWRADYALQTLAKVLTAVISLITAVALWPLMPKALALPTIRDLQRVIEQLEHEAGKRLSTEEHLHNVERRLADTMTLMGSGFIATDREGRITSMNAVAEALIGRSAATTTGLPLGDVLQWVAQAATASSAVGITDLIADPTATTSTQRGSVVSSDGRQTEVELQIDLTRDVAGSVRGALVLIRDMSLLIKAEMNSRRLAAIVESASDAIIGTTLDGRITSWNHAARSIFGYNAEEIIGQPVQRLIPPERESEEMQILAELRDGHVVPAFDTVRRAKGGEDIEVSLIISPIRDARGVIVGGAKIMRNIGAQRKAEREALRYAQELERTNQDLDQFVYAASHDLRAPLRAAVTVAQWILDDDKTVDPKTQERLRIIQQRITRMTRLLDDILQYARLGQASDVASVPLNAAALVGEIRDTLNLPAGFSIIADPSLDQVTVPRMPIEQVLHNLIANACKHHDKESGVVRIEVQKTSLGLRFRVCDDGPGVPVKYRQTIFEMFKTLKAQTDSTGSGMGLAIVRKIILRHGGNVGVDCEGPRGSCFWFDWPTVTQPQIRRETPA